MFLVCSVIIHAQDNDGKYIEVTGSSEIEVIPDEIHYLIEIKEYWEEEFKNKSKQEDYQTKVPLAKIEKDLRQTLSYIGISSEAIRTQEVGNYWRQRGKELLVSKLLDVQLADAHQIDAIIQSVDARGIQSMRIGELKNKNILEYRKQGKIAALKAAREKASYLVEAMGQKLGGVLRIIEPTERYMGMNTVYQSVTNVAASAGVEEYRTIKLRTEMTARFAIEPLGK